jgi:superfamily II DNA or RNA helicase
MADSVAQVDPTGQRVGIVQAATRQVGAEIISASFQSLGSVARIHELGRRDVILCDEAHHAPAKSFTNVLNNLGAFDESNAVRVAGFTATMSRGKAGGLGDVWQDVVFERDIVWGIESGFLVKPRGLTVQLPELDLSKVKISRGDYAKSSLESAMAASVDSTVTAAMTYLRGRATIVFAAGIDHAEALAEALTVVGIKSECVTGSMPTTAREHVYDRFRNGTLDAMVTVQVLTEGADFPRCDAVLMARPTKSRTLYIQMVGRALRPYDGKVDALVIDLTGAARGHSLVVLTDLVTDAKSPTMTPEGDELIDDEPEELEKVARPERMGPIELEELDLLTAGRDRVHWLKTRGGVWFFEASGTLVFLWPEGGGVKIGHMTTKGEKSGGYLAGGMVGPIDQAMDAAEQLCVSELMLQPPSAEAPWRNTRDPSAAQMKMAQLYGIPDAELMNRARLSDEISIAIVTKRLGM